MAWLRRVLATTLILNAIDATATLVWVTEGWAQEANPLMDLLLAQSPVLFMGVKLALVSLGVLLLWRLRASQMALAGGTGVAAVYGGILVQHARIVHALVS